VRDRDTGDRLKDPNERKQPVLASEEEGGTLDALRFSLATDIVELVVLTTDETFLQTLREAVGGSRRLWHVASSDKVSDLLVAGEVGILVLDVQSLNEAASVFVGQIKRQFPDLVVVVAGNRDAEISLAGLISAGIVYRFIHKPMSPGRAKLFADAAVKKYDEHRRRAATPPPRRSSRFPRSTLIGGTLGAVGVILVAAWAMHRNSGNDAAPPNLAGASGAAGVAHPSAAGTLLLTRAAAALAANRLTEPAGDNALELYLQAQAQNPAGETARAGLAEVRERLLARAETALLEERLDEASAAIETARKSGVEHGRIAFLSAQLAKSRDRVKAAQAAAQARSEPKAGGDKVERLLDPAAQRLGDAAADGISAPADIEAAQTALAAARRQADTDARAQLLKNAAERMQQDRLIEPADDSAKYYLLTLRGLDPGNAGLPAALQDLGNRLVVKARRALSLGQYDAARSWLSEAAAIGFASAESGSVQHDLDAADAEQRFLTNVIAAGDLTLVKSANPTYPKKAESNKTQGWVELDFTVAENGAVKDVVVHAASAPGVFDDAAIGALLQWRYKPVLRDAKPVAQRARIRIRFALAN
jgi:TonB family protein